jgi:hypothetical protein
MNGCYYIKVISQMARIGGSLLLAILWACLLTSSNSWCYFNKFSTANDVFEASYSPDGQYIVVAINDKRNYVYETATYSAVFTYTSPLGGFATPPNSVPTRTSSPTDSRTRQ